MGSYHKSYCLKLANGKEWHLMATAELGSWIERLASIMELKACKPEAHPKLIFMRGEPGKEEWAKLIYEFDLDVRKSLSESGWRSYHLRWLRVWFHHGAEDMICDIGHEEDRTTHDEERHTISTMSMWLALRPIFLKAEQVGGLLFHAALIKRNPVGVLIAGPGETGKSTCCRRIPSPWYAVCDDETLIVRDHHGRYLIHPFPTWSDYIFRRSERTWNVQQHFPLSAIFFLEQAENDEAIPIGEGQAAVLINRSTAQAHYVSGLSLNREELHTSTRKVFDNACELAKAVPAFMLRVSLTGRFWMEIERVMTEFPVPRK